MHLADKAYQQLFRHLFVYNVLFEDTEVDERFLGVGPDSRILGISGAGCGIANHVSRRPRRIDAVDINARHLAITALKAASARALTSYEEFYRLWGHGTHANPARLAERLTADLPVWIRRHWKLNSRIFKHSFHHRGLTARLLGAMRRLARVDIGWFRALIAAPMSERPRLVADTFGPILRKGWVSAALRSPLHLLAIGVNTSQRDRMLRAEGLDDVIDYLVMHLGRVAQTDLERNWFAWYAVVGDYNHECADAVPPFMRRDHHEMSLGSPTDLRFHHRNIFDVLADAGPRTWTHYTLLDAPDWMSNDIQRKLLSEILRTSEDGAVVLHRSVETDSMPERHGLSRHFVPMAEASDLGTRMDRTRQFRRVSFYQVAH